MTSVSSIVPLLLLVSLPAPDRQGPLESLLEERRSHREFSERALPLSALSQLLWAGQGTGSRPGRRTAPSAGALYPLELHVVAGNVDGLAAGHYRYRPSIHELLPVSEGDLREELSSAALGQDSVRDAAAVIVICAVAERTTRKYDRRGVRYVHMEVGHAAQNVYLQATALGLGAVMVGAFDDEEVGRLLALPAGEKPLGLLPVGRPD